MCLLIKYLIFKFEFKNKVEGLQYNKMNKCLFYL